MVVPILQIACIQQVLDELDEPPIMDMLPQRRDEQLMIQVVERSINSIPCSRTRMRQRQRKSKSLTLGIPSSDAVFP